LAVLWRDIARLAHSLSARPEAQARCLWQAQLRQDWSGLPDDLRQALAEQGPAAFKSLALHALRTASSARALQLQAQQLAERPWLVLQVVLGAADARSWLGGERLQRIQAERTKLSRVAEGSLQLLQAEAMVQALLPSGSGVPHEHLDALPQGWVPARTDPGAAAAAALLSDREALKSLCAAWQAAFDRAATREVALDDLAIELDGTALGVHGSLHRLLQDAADVDEVALTSMRPGPEQRHAGA
jgi:hypothetical protein